MPKIKNLKYINNHKESSEILEILEFLSDELKRGYLIELEYDEKNNVFDVYVCSSELLKSIIGGSGQSLIDAIIDAKKKFELHLFQEE